MEQTRSYEPTTQNFPLAAHAAPDRTTLIYLILQVVSPHIIPINVRHLASYVNAFIIYLKLNRLNFFDLLWGTTWDVVSLRNKRL